MGGQVVLEQHLVAVAQVEQEQMLEEGEKIRLFEFKYKNKEGCVQKVWLPNYSKTSTIFPNNGHLVISHKHFNLLELTDAQACPEHMIDIRYYSNYSILHL